MDLRELKYGLEIETIGKTRREIAGAIQSVVGGEVKHIGAPQCYDPWQVTDARGRTWKVVADSSLTSVSKQYQAEVVTPVLTYGDIPELQKVVRAIRRAGGRVDKSCGIHCHLDMSRFNARQVSNLVRYFYKYEDYLMAALKINSQRARTYAKPIRQEVIRRIEQRRPTNLRELNTIWYGYYNSRPTHYHSSRYCWLNVHGIFYRQALEIQAFDGTLHAGRLRAYLTLCLAMAAKAHGAKAISSKKSRIERGSGKYSFRVLLISGLMLNGPEFKNVRRHLLANLEGSSAWKYGRRAA
jgi:hypothetical protein